MPKSPLLLPLKRSHNQGPAIIEESNSTTVLFPGDVARVTENGHLVIAIHQGHHHGAPGKRGRQVGEANEKQIEAV